MVGGKCFLLRCRWMLLYLIRFLLLFLWTKAPPHILSYQSCQLQYLTWSDCLQILPIKAFTSLYTNTSFCEMYTGRCHTEMLVLPQCCSLTSKSHIYFLEFSLPMLCLTSCRQINSCAFYCRSWLTTRTMCSSGSTCYNSILLSAPRAFSRTLVTDV